MCLWRLQLACVSFVVALVVGRGRARSVKQRCARTQPRVSSEKFDISTMNLIYSLGSKLHLKFYNQTNQDIRDAGGEATLGVSRDENLWVFREVLEPKSAGQ
mmetsp:Transcript_18977/g.25744  ORF Transcript_18977/g.25744 Transcript_18977/m.25744 type:complete len:102 (-) Transcript_18977:1405-1710(-)